MVVPVAPTVVGESAPHRSVCSKSSETSCAVGGVGSEHLGSSVGLQECSGLSASPQHHSLAPSPR